MTHSSDFGPACDQLINEGICYSKISVLPNYIWTDYETYYINGGIQQEYGDGIYDCTIGMG